MDGIFELTSPDGSVFRLKIESGNVSMGGKDTCIVITYEGPEKSMLHWLGTDEQCELRGFPVSADESYKNDTSSCEEVSFLNVYRTEGEKTKQMVYLATSIFRSIHRDVNFLHLIDSSTYKCGEFPDGLLRSISLRETHFVFHGKTYYEDKFHAFPSKPDGKKRIEEFRKAIHDPSKKPETFSFVTPEISAELTPIYNSTKTWWDFFQAIQSKWKKEKCAKIYIWYRKALSIMVNDTIPEHWTIDIRKFPIIRPKLKRIPTKGGTRKRRKSILYRPFDDPWDLSGLIKW